MTQLLVFREHIIRFYQRHARILRPLFQFVISFVVFFAINQEVGYNPSLRSWYIILGLAALGLILPVQVLLFVAAVYTVAHIYFVSIVLALVSAVFFAILYFVYVRFVPEHGYVILAAPILYALKIPYVLPLVLGLASTPIAVIPMSCGIILYKLFQTMTMVIGTTTDDSIAMYNQVIQQAFSNRELYFTVGIFILVTIVVFIIKNLSFPYSFESAILAGALLNIILFLITNFLIDDTINIRHLIIQTVISMGIAWFFQFFLRILNYTGTEYLQFEDDEYFYYVKAVPKINITTPKKRIKRFSPSLFMENRMEEEFEDTEEESEETKVESEETEEEIEETEDMLEKHDFDFKVSVDDEVFEQEEASQKED